MKLGVACDGWEIKSSDDIEEAAKLQCEPVEHEGCSVCDPLEINTGIPCYKTVFVEELPEAGISGILYVTKTDDEYSIYEWDGSIFVNVTSPASCTLQTKTVTPTASQVQYLPDSGYDGFEKFTVEAIPSEYIVPSGTKSITANGNGQDVVGYAAVNVNVPNSYAAADEGKVVQSGALVAQTSDTVTQNGTVDTTLINSLTVNVSGGGGEDLNKMIQGTLTTITNSDVTSIARGAFQYSALQSASFPNVETIGNSAFGSCASLSSVSFPKAKNISAGNVFDGTAIQILVLPAITSESGSYAFRNNAAMTHLDLGSGFRGFGVQACAGNTNMATIILRKSSGIVTLGQTSVFNNTPFKSGGTGGTIYIPKAMYDHLGDNSSYDYKAATNWSTVDGYGTITWAKIEGSIYATQYADGTPIT